MDKRIKLEILPIYVLELISLQFRRTQKEKQSFFYTCQTNMHQNDKSSEESSSKDAKEA